MDDSRQPPESTLGSPMRSETARQIASLIARLLSHFWATGEPESLRREQAHDWLDDLREFAPKTVARACAEWRRGQTRRPMIADIRKLCIEDREIYNPPPKLALIKPNRVQREERKRSRDVEMQLQGRDLINKWARQKGFADVDAYAQARGTHWSEVYREHIGEVFKNSPIAKGMSAVIPTAAALGVKAREYTPSELLQARTELGLGGDQ